MSDSKQHSMYENEHAEFLFAKVLAPHVSRLPVEQDRLDACHHLARLVEQLEAAHAQVARANEETAAALRLADQWKGEALGTKEQYETQRHHLETAAVEAHRRGVEAYELREQLRTARAEGYDEGVEDVWNENVCSTCGENHDRDASAMCETGEVVSFREWADATRGRDRGYCETGICGVCEGCDPASVPKP